MLKIASLLIIMSRLYLPKCESLNKTNIYRQIYERNQIETNWLLDRPESILHEDDRDFFLVASDNSNLGGMDELEGSGNDLGKSFIEEDGSVTGRDVQNMTEVDTIDKNIVVYSPNCTEPGYTKICSGRGECLHNKCKCNSFVMLDEDTNTTIAYKFSGKFCEECPYCKGQRCANFLECIECHLMNTDTPICDKFCPYSHNKVNQVLRNIETDEKMCELENQDGCFFKFKYFYNENNDVHVEFEQDFLCLDGTKFLIFMFWIVVAYIILLMILIPRVCPVPDKTPKLTRSLTTSVNSDVIRLEMRDFD